MYYEKYRRGMPSFFRILRPPFPHAAFSRSFRAQPDFRFFSELRNPSAPHIPPASDSAHRYQPQPFLPHISDATVHRNNR